MPLFDPDNAESAEASALWHLADLIAECSNAHELAEKTAGTDAENKAATLLKVIVGPHDGAWEGDRFQESELAERFIAFQIWSPIEGGKTVVRSDGSFDRADEGGDFMLAIRRYARASEMVDKQDLYLFFLDRVAALEQEMMTRSETRECPRLQSVARQQGPAFGARDKATSQGEYLFATHSITWGDAIQD